MASYRFTGEYKGNMRGSAIILGSRLAKDLSEHNISKLYLSGRETLDGERLYTSIDAFPEKRSEDAFEAAIEKRRMQIPKNLAQYARLGRNKVIIVGMPGQHGDYLEIWSTDEIERFLGKPLTDAQVENIAAILPGNKP